MEGHGSMFSMNQTGPFSRHVFLSSSISPFLVLLLFPFLMIPGILLKLILTTVKIWRRKKVLGLADYTPSPEHRC